MKLSLLNPLNMSWVGSTPHPTPSILWHSLKILPVLFFLGTTQTACLSTSNHRLAEQRVQEGDYQGAVDMYQAVIDEKPETAAARRAQLALGKLHIDKMNRPEIGVRMYQELIAAAPDSEVTAEAYYRLGFYYFKAADYVAAQKSFDSVVNQFHTLNAAITHS